MFTDMYWYEIISPFTLVLYALYVPMICVFIVTYLLFPEYVIYLAAFVACAMAMLLGWLCAHAIKSIRTR